MQLRCNYHSAQWAEWHCPHCERDFCRQCVPGGHDYKLRAGGPKCVLCLQKLEYLGSAVGAPRPLQQLLTNLTFPFRSNALFVYVALTAATVPFLFLLQGPLVGFAILPLLIFYTLILEYAGAILLARSEGKSVPPTWGESFKGMDWLYLVKHVLTAAAAIQVTNFCIGINPVFGFLVGALCVFIFPAALIILTIDRSISRAINPLLLITMVRPFIKDYCVFYGIALVLAIFFWQTFNTILNSNGMGLALFWYVGLVAAVYACYAMLGYLMFYYQFDLGNCFVVDKGEQLSKKDHDKQRAMGDSDVLLAEGKLDEARHVLRATMDSMDKDLDVHARYHAILLKTDDAEAINNHTNFYMGLLLENDGIKTASKAYRAVKARLPDFLPQAAAVRYQLAQQLAKELDFQGAIDLLRSFHEHFPDSQLIGDAYLLAATVLHEHLHDSHRAASLLQFVLEHYPNAKVIAEIKKLAQKVRKQL